jgi:hypothetical protein
MRQLIERCISRPVQELVLARIPLNDAIKNLKCKGRSIYGDLFSALSVRLFA